MSTVPSYVLPLPTAPRTRCNVSSVGGVGPSRRSAPAHGSPDPLQCRLGNSRQSNGPQCTLRAASCQNRANAAIAPCTRVSAPLSRIRTSSIAPDALSRRGSTVDTFPKRPSVAPARLRVAENESSFLHVRFLSTAADATLYRACGLASSNRLGLGARCVACIFKCGTTSQRAGYLARFCFGVTCAERD
jgi:hypothetical protein